MEKRNSSFKIAVFITLVIAIALVAFVVMNNNNETANETTFDKQPPIEGQPVLGEPNAPVTVVEFGDFKCPACKAWGERIFPQLINDYVKTDKVKFAYINVLFHGEESKLGSIAAEAIYEQDPVSYWLFHKGYLTHNHQWKIMMIYGLQMRKY